MTFLPYHFVQRAARARRWFDRQDAGGALQFINNTRQVRCVHSELACFTATRSGFAVILSANLKKSKS
jgi:hypothetical protein